MSTTTPVYTGNADGNIDTSASLAASASRSSNWDITTKFEGQVHILNTPGGTVAATRGVRVQVYRRYGPLTGGGPTTAESPLLTYTLPSATASTAESIDFYLGPGVYSIKLTNLDAVNAVTCEITGDTVDSLTTTV